MAKKLDDEQLAKEDIVARPEITQTAPEAVEAAPAAASEATPEAVEIDDEAVDRRVRIFSRSVGRLLKKSTGDDVSEDEAAELAEVGGALFGFLMRFPAGRVAGSIIVAGLVAVPFIPRLFKAIKKKEVENV